MRSALRWTRWFLAGDIAVIAAIMLALALGSAVGADIQPLGWATVFYGGVLVVVAVVLSILALLLQLAVAARRND